MTIEIRYDKKQVIQALRYHFLSRPEIRVMIILVNVFALFSALLFFLKKATPLAFLVVFTLWFCLMITLWSVLPNSVYSKASTFKDHFTMNFEKDFFSVGNERSYRSWPWKALKNFIETPHFFHLYFDSRSFFLIPKNSFASRDDIYKMRQMLRQKVGR